jgi:hypothetical protein
MPHIVVLANQTIGGAGLLELVRERSEDPDATFSLIVPMTKPKSGYVIYDDAVRDSAQVRVDLALSFLRSRGIAVSGEVGDEDPYTAALDAAREYHPDEIVVSTLPATTSGWLKRDLIERIQQDTGVPVTHVVSDILGEDLPYTISLVVANQTAAHDKLIERLKEKAESTRNQVFIIVVPLSEGGGRAAAIARGRLGNTIERLRREELLVAGMLGDPDPYTATMNALQYFHVHDVIISTLPETRSGWLRADLIARVRKASNVDIEHIVAERDRTEA